MIITRTPLRVSFLGGGTDYPQHFLKHGGQTLGAAIDKYTYVTAKRLPDLFDYRIRVSYSRIELVKDIDRIEHPAVRESLRYCGINGGVEIGVVADLPARSGLGSSSSFTVGLLHALHAHQGQLADRAQLAAEAVHVEQDMIRERVGVQDQYTCASGGICWITCGRDGTVHVAPLPLTAERRHALEQRLILFDTGIQRHAHEVLAEQMQRTVQGDLTDDLSHLSKLVDQGVQALSGSGSLDEFGALLHDAWMVKRRLSTQITNGVIDGYYETARKAGAVGGKLLGAGAGGFLLIYARPENQERVRKALSPLHSVRFSFDFTGSTILFYHPESDDY